MVSNSSYQEFSNYLYVHTKVTNERQMLRVISLTDEARAALHRGPDQFFSHCGDEFAAGRQTGDKVEAIVQFRTLKSGLNQSSCGDTSLHRAICFSPRLLRPIPMITGRIYFSPKLRSNHALADLRNKLQR